MRTGTSAGSLLGKRDMDMFSSDQLENSATKLLRVVESIICGWCVDLALSYAPGIRSDVKQRPMFGVRAPLGHVRGVKNSERWCQQRRAFATSVIGR